MDHPKLVEDAAANVLANHEILMASPSAAKLNSFYPTPSESSSTVAQAVINAGQMTIQANSKQIGGTADFLISTPNILDVPQLNLSFKVKAMPVPVPDSNGVDQRTRAYMCTYHDGWGFDCIDRIEMTVAKSNISNLQLQGHAMRDWSLLQCKNADERKQMLRIAGVGKTWSLEKEMTMEASIPLSFLFFRSAGGVKGGFGIDGRALHGPITFQIYFKPINYFCSPAASVYHRDVMGVTFDKALSSVGDGSQADELRGATYPASIDPTSLLPTEFSSLEFTARTYQLMDGIFSVSKALESNPSLTYSIPSLWLNTYTQEVPLSANGTGQININSIPAGMLQAIIVRIRPVNYTKYLPYNFETAAASKATDAVLVGDYQSRLNYNPPDFTRVVRPASDGDPTTFDRTQTGVTRAYRPYNPWSLPLKSIRLEYSGQSIYSAKTASSHDNFTRAAFNDDLRTDVCGLPLSLNVVGQTTRGAALFDRNNSEPKGNYGATVLENLGDKAMVDHETQVIVIPLCHDANGVFRNRDFENLPHYSGSTLQLQFQVEPFNTYKTDGLDREQCFNTGAQVGYDPDYGNDYEALDAFQDDLRWKPELPSSSCASRPSNRLQHVACATGPNQRESVGVLATPPNASTADSEGPSFEKERVLFNNNPNASGAAAFDGGGGTVQLDLTYVMASLFQITNGTSELQL
jgi:hypothetical protein